MKKTLLAATAATALLASAAHAQNIGVTMALFDDNFLTVLRNGMIEMAGQMDGMTLQVEDARNDVARQLNQIDNFIASGVDAIIVNPVDTSATEAMSAAADRAGVPLIYVNRQPINMDTLPANQAFVASNEVESSTMATFEACKMLRAQGLGNGANVVIMMGELSNQAAIQRTKNVDDVLAMDMCSFMNVVDRQTANWQRDEARNLMMNWLSTGETFHAVLSNNDEMALGAIQALRTAGISMDDVIVTGVDATQDALAAMQAGDLDFTVFQDAAGQGAGALRAALDLIAGNPVSQRVFIPFQLVTPANVADFLGTN